MVRAFLNLEAVRSSKILGGLKSQVSPHPSWNPAPPARRQFPEALYVPRTGPCVQTHQAHGGHFIFQPEYFVLSESNLVSLYLLVPLSVVAIMTFWSVANMIGEYMLQNAQGSAHRRHLTETSQWYNTADFSGWVVSLGHVHKIVNICHQGIKTWKITQLSES